MLDELHVRDVALIEDATIAFSPGLTVLSGETGAGKTALLSALRLVSGQRADSKMVRDGAREALAEARFVAEEEHVVRRRLSAQGRSRCTVDGEMATVSELSSVADFLHIHSQHEQIKLMSPTTQVAYLDAWISSEGAHLESYVAAFKKYRELDDELQRLAQAQEKASQEIEFLRFTAAEIDKVSPQQGEYEDLESELPKLQHGEQLAQSVSGALSALQGDGTALDLLAEAADLLSSQRGIDEELDVMSERLVSAQVELEDLSRDLGSYVGSIQYDPGRLEQVLDRLGELSGIMKRFGPSMDQVFAKWDEALRAIESEHQAPERLETLRADVAQAKSALEAEASKLSDARKKAAKDYCALLEESVHELSMEGARFEFSFEPVEFDKWTAAGPDKIELLYCPSGASAARSMGQIASGGELSRILLALECIRHDGSEQGDMAPTLVFDEVDQGIGGATGTVVAKRIAHLAQHAQVIVVTHLAQVAAFADLQYVVSKAVDEEGVSTTTVAEVEGESRVAEIARMLSGTADDAAIEHARTLIEEAVSRA